MYYIALLCMSMCTFFCNAMNVVKHVAQPNKHLNSLFSSIIHYEHQETAAVIAEYPQFVNACTMYQNGRFSEEMTPVHVAALVGNSDALKNMLRVSQESVNAVTQEGNTPLHFASNERVARLLLDNGAQPNAQNEKKYTPLYAALYGIASHEHEPYFDVAYYLLQQGADINKNCRFGETLLHKATSENMSAQYAQFLLDNGADGDIKDNRGETPFDQITMVQREVFQRSGYCYFNWGQSHHDDPFELFKKSPRDFLGGNKIWNIMRDLYSTAQQQEKNPQSRSKSFDAVTVQADRNAKLYIFKKASFADLEMYFGTEAISCLRKYFENLLREDQDMIIQGKKPCVYVLDGVDAQGDSLLHTAVKHKQSDIIQFLIGNKSIDCTTQNNEGKVAFDYLLDRKSKAAFFDALIKKFFARKLNPKTENFVLNRLFYSKDISEKGRLYYFLMTLRNYPEKSWFFLEHGINVNDKWRGISPLSCAIQPWLQTVWKKIPTINTYNICALLAAGAVVDEKMILASRGYMKKLLQTYYEK